MTFRDPLQAAHARIAALEADVTALLRGQSPRASVDSAQERALRETVEALREQVTTLYQTLHERETELAEAQAEAARERIMREQVEAMGQAVLTHAQAVEEAQRTSELAVAHSGTELAKAEWEQAEQRAAALEAELEAVVGQGAEGARHYYNARLDELEARRQALAAERERVELAADAESGDGVEAMVAREVAAARRQAFDDESSRLGLAIARIQALLERIDALAD